MTGHVPSSDKKPDAPAPTRRDGSPPATRLDGPSPTTRDGVTADRHSLVHLPPTLAKRFHMTSVVAATGGEATAADEDA